MFKQNLEKILEELNTFRRKSRAQILSNCVKEKLDLTVQKYNSKVSWNAEYLATRDSSKVLKALTKLQKKDDRDALDSMIEGEEYSHYD